MSVKTNMIGDGRKPLKPRFHGNGFIQVYLNDITRLHIWSPDFPATRVQNAQIHDHRFWFTSKVLMGALLHKEYDVSTEYSGRKNGDGQLIGDKFPHGLYKTEGHSKVAPLQKVHTCRVELAKSFLYEAGETYGFGGPGNYHETVGLQGEITASIMTKTKEDSTYNAHIVAINDEEPDHAFETQPDEEELRLEVRRVWEMLI